VSGKNTGELQGNSTFAAGSDTMTAPEPEPFQPVAAAASNRSDRTFRKQDHTSNKDAIFAEDAK
jgi:hypothetical protein